MVGCEIPETVEGKSLVSSILEDKRVRNTAYFAYGDVVRGVRNDRYKLIEYRYQDKKKRQFFDMEQDKWEINSLEKHVETLEIQEELSKELERYCHEWEDDIHIVGQRFWDKY